MSTADVFQQHFVWRTLSVNVETFFKSCIHCLWTVGARRVRRPYSPTVHGTAANDLFQFGYIEIAKAYSGKHYVLMLCDDYLNYRWLFACPETSHKHAIRAAIDWCTSFGVPRLKSDCITHLDNDVLPLFAKWKRVPQHFTLPHSPWNNGGVERIVKELLRVFPAMVSELRLDHDDWPDLLPLVQSAIDNISSLQQAGESTITAMTGLAATPPISTFYHSSRKC